jgi:WD40 repeat protein
MRKISFIFVLVFLQIQSLGLYAQASERPAITRENAGDVQLLAQLGWFDGLQSFDPAVREIDTVENPLWPASVIAFNADGTLFALGNDNNEVVLFDVIDEPPFIVENHVFREHLGPVYSLAFHPDGIHLASGGRDGMIYVWDIVTGEIDQTIETYPRSAVYGLTYNVDGSALWCSTTQGYTVLEEAETRCYTFGSSDSTTYNIAFTADGSLMAYGNTTLDPSDGESVVLPTRRSWSDTFSSFRTKLTFSADGSVLLNSGINQRTYVWHLDDLFHPLNADAALMALSPDGSLISGHNLLILDSTTGEVLLSLEPTDLRYGQEAYFRYLPRDAVFSPDGTLVVTANIDGTLRFWGLPS